MTNSPHKSHKKSIRNLKQNAEKGHLLSMFQLYEDYSSGKNVEAPDKELAAFYLRECCQKIKETEFRLDALNLYEFRRIRDLDIKFDESLTVIIGDNGAGKTSIAEAVAKSLSWLNSNLLKDNVNGEFIRELDIHVDAKEYGGLFSQVCLNKDNKVEIELRKPVNGFSGSATNTVADIKQLGALYRRVAEEENDLEVPLLAFYSVERSSTELSKSDKEESLKEKLTSRFSSLKEALKASAHLDVFTRKYIELVNLAEGRSDLELNETKQKIVALHAIIEDLKRKDDPDIVEMLTKQLLAEQEYASKLQANAFKLLGASTSNYSQLLEQVNSAIETLVPDVKNLSVDRSSGNPRILVDNFGNKVNVAQLSQGQKTLVALTGDLALRLVMLNPAAKAPLEGQGIVVIDEVELHLHPMWQQRVISGLRKTFPNIQFIVTTHSPQVLSTVNKKCIRQIYFDENGQPKVKVPEFQTRGVTSADVLAQIMATHSVPQDIPEAVLVSQFHELIAQGKISNIQEILHKITRHFGEDHPVTLSCKEALNLHELKKKYIKAKK